MIQALVLTMILVVTSVVPATAQDEAPMPTPQPAVPVVEEAEMIFQQALNAFRAGDYGMAYRRFRLVTDSHPFNVKTTGAALMAAKSLYRDGRFEHAIELLDAFIDRYPTSGYINEAQRVRGFAARQIEEGERQDRVLQIGVALPLSGSGAVTQSMFNGIRVAVEAHNRVSREQLPARIVFRDTHGDPSTAREVVADLARQNVDVIIGPIFSDEARAAAEEAERRGVVLIAPLATDEDVAQGKRFVFQANTPIAQRGRVIARHAMRTGFDNFGIVAREGDSISERMAEGFEEEIFLEGGNILFYHLLRSNADWATISESVGRDTLAQAGALYLALIGQNSPTLAEQALRGFEEAEVRPRVLGADGWHDLPFMDVLSEFETTYATDFHVDRNSSAARDFDQRFRALANTAPDRPAFTGYDVTTYLLSRKLTHTEDDFRSILTNDVSYQGVGVRFDFSESNINQAMFIFGYRNGQMQLMR
jgi:branched-chain amino acid transport system substrate-binding protein